MTELSLLYFFLGIAFVLAPLMTNKFLLRESKAYSDSHKVSIIVLVLGALINLKYAVFVWPLFCAFGLFLYLKNASPFIFSIKGLAACIPFIFSLISAVWFVAGVNDSHLLGYNTAWSLYAALHGSFLGWLFVGCLVFLLKRAPSGKMYLLGCYLCFILFLCVAFGIDGVPYIKRVGVIGFSLLVPFLIGLYSFNVRKENRTSLFLSLLSLLSITCSMALAILNEYWADAPRIAFGLSTMVLTHGFVNAVITVPCFYLAITLENRGGVKTTGATEDVIFFDEFCVLCTGTVALLIRLDRKRAFKYSSLQGKYAHETLDRDRVDSGTSVIFRSGGLLYERGEAVVRILMKLGGVYRLLGIALNLLPFIALNALYDCIARNRYRIFGKKDICLVPTSENGKLFIP